MGGTHHTLKLYRAGGAGRGPGFSVKPCVMHFGRMRKLEGSIGLGTAPPSEITRDQTSEASGLHASDMSTPGFVKGIRYASSHDERTRFLPCEKIDSSG